MAHKWAMWLHNPYCVGRPQLFRAVDNSSSGPQMGKLATYYLLAGGSPMPQSGGEKLIPLVASAPPVLVLLAAVCVARPWALPSPLLLVGACGLCGVCSLARVPPSAPSARVASFSSPRVRCAFVAGPAVLWWCCVVLVLCVGCRLGTPVPWLSALVHKWANW